MIKKRKIKTEEEERWKIKPAEWEINLSETKKIPLSTFFFSGRFNLIPTERCHI